ncbi:hypothetical protein [Rhodobacter capsulatus]|jgi:hypothetical protein|uniref:Uncharacterized protein n=1 Tax=Rhodobacter phage RcapNL TaxID=1131316 RepID=H6WBQ9_9CAUD|nr:hypothetical protein [Rhodobacter capsulatus]YP_007518438.1 hypothetical protein I920_gp56 [Rhodobacter phage RcapNL]AFA44896.1 hypothetical protein RcapNL_00056 [Rhodobacter phage RcapNL]AFK66571.1 hypothetical protein RHZG_00065 [Rhodobacter phage RcNL1]MDS0926134.1 hypothetical protein [Rhodobacter capsulatus]
MSQLPYALSQAEQDVLDERRGQRTREGFDAAHDDAHELGEMALAGACYAREAWSALALGVGDTPVPGWAPEDWPWHSSWWKPSGNRRNLVKAAALILAEIERLDRAAARKGGAA